MSATTPPPTGKVDNGAFIPTGQIYNEVVDMKQRMVKLETTIALVGLLVTPLLSTVSASIVTSIIGGK